MASEGISRDRQLKNMSNWRLSVQSMRMEAYLGSRFESFGFARRFFFACGRFSFSVLEGGAFRPRRLVRLIMATRSQKPTFDNHLEQLQKKIPSKDFTVIIAAPFVVIGDEPPEMVRRRAENTVNGPWRS